MSVDDVLSIELGRNDLPADPAACARNSHAFLESMGLESMGLESMGLESMGA